MSTCSGCRHLVDHGNGQSGCKNNAANTTKMRLAVRSITPVGYRAWPVIFLASHITVPCKGKEAKEIAS